MGQPQRGTVDAHKQPLGKTNTGKPRSVQLGVEQYHHRFAPAY